MSAEQRNEKRATYIYRVFSIETERTRCIGVEDKTHKLRWI
jgi:hypothetical protein